MKNIWLIFVIFILLSSVSNSQIRINEAMPSNHTSYYDEDYYPADWIELYNSSAQDIDLSGYRISDKNNYAKAYKLPKVTIKSKSYKTIFASEKTMPEKKRYIIENSAYGIPHRDRQDEFHYEYLKLTGDFSAELDFQSMRNAPHEALAGIMLRKDLGIESEYVGIFCKSASHKGIISQCRKVKGENSYYIFPAFIIDYPKEIISMKRIGDTVYTNYLYNDIFTKQHGAFYFPHNQELYLGIAVSSADRKFSSIFAFNHFIVNNDTIKYENLIKHEIGGLSKSSTYYSDEVHTDFKLSSGGENIYLWSPNGELISEMELPTITGGFPCNVSYGLIENNTNESAYMKPATPNDTNDNYNIAIAQMPSIAVAEQWSDNSISTRITNNEPGAVIYYTLDGNAPTEQSTQYSGSILQLDSNTIIRAVAIKDGMLPSYIITKSFFVGDSSSLPVVSIAIDSLSLWSDKYGMFQNKNMHTAPEAFAHFELFDTNKVSVFASDCGMQLHGNVTREYPQKSLRLSAKRQFGPDEWVYPFFDQESQPSTESFILRNAGNDWKGSYLRDGIMGVACRQLRNVETMAFKSYLSFINGQFWGIYNMRERLDEEYLSIKYGVSEESINLIVPNDEVNSGSLKPYADFINKVKTLDMNKTDDYKFMQDNVDIESLIDYTLAELYCFNFDWINNNVKVWNSPEYDGKWRWMIYDTDFGLGWAGSVPWGNFMPTVFKPDTSRYSTIVCKLLESEDFRIKFYNRSCDLLNTQFSAERMTTITDSLANIIRKDIPRQQAKWVESCPEWEKKVDVVRWWVSLRADSMPNTYIDYFKLSGKTKLEFSPDINKKADIKLSTIYLNNFPWAGTYFKQVPIELEILPKQGRKFIHWIINDKKYTDAQITISPDSNLMVINAVFDNEDIQLHPVINEIMYKSANNSPDWIEIYNPSNEEINLSNWVIKDSDNSHNFTVPNHTKLSPKSFLVITEDTSKFSTIYSNEINLLGNMNFGLGKEDMVRLYNDVGELIDSVSYTSAAPWYPVCYGGGSSLELNEYDSDNSLAINWSACKTSGGTPGFTNSLSYVIENMATPSSAIYPNPNSGIFESTINSTVSGAAILELCDYLGRVVESKDIILNEGINKFNSDITQFPASIYHLRIRKANSGEILLSIPFVKE